MGGALETILIHKDKVSRKGPLRAPTPGLGSGNRKPALNVASIPISPPPQVRSEDIGLRVTIGEQAESLPIEKQKHLAPRASWDYRQVKAQEGEISLLLYIPEADFQKLTVDEAKMIAERYVKRYRIALERFSKLGGSIPPDHEFEVVFGETLIDRPHAGDGRVHPHLLGFSTAEVFRGAETIIHEIGHVLCRLAGVKALGASFIALEEGLCDYLAGATLSNWRYRISKEQADRMNGLTQLDVEASLVGREKIFVPSLKRYLGATHHLFGPVFIEAFLEFFPDQKLLPFLKELSIAREAEKGNGNSWVARKRLLELMCDGKDPDKLDAMTYMGLSMKILEFEKRLHALLMEKVFSTSEGSPIPQNT